MQQDLDLAIFLDKGYVCLSVLTETHSKLPPQANLALQQAQDFFCLAKQQLEDRVRQLQIRHTALGFSVKWEKHHVNLQLTESGHFEVDTDALISIEAEEDFLVLAGYWDMNRLNLSQASASNLIGLCRTLDYICANDEYIILF